MPQTHFWQSRLYTNYPSRDWEWASPPTLGGQDAFPSGRGLTLDQPNPLPLKLEDKWTFAHTQFQGVDSFLGPGQAWPTHDWPNPQPLKYAPDLRTFTDLLKVNLASQDKFFGLAGSPNFDWPVFRLLPRSSDLSTFLNALAINLIGQDRFFGLAGKPNFDWPLLWRSIQANPEQWIQNLQSTLLFPLVVQAPFFQTDWQNPLLSPLRVLDYQPGMFPALASQVAAETLMGGSVM